MTSKNSPQNIRINALIMVTDPQTSKFIREKKFYFEPPSAEAYSEPNQATIICEKNVKKL